VFLVFDSPAILFLGGDPSAGSPTDTLFTFFLMSPWSVDYIFILKSK